jgi:hypothetical protein
MFRTVVIVVGVDIGSRSALIPLIPSFAAAQEPHEPIGFGRAPSASSGDNVYSG